jgi:hypothetical protein
MDKVDQCPSRSVTSFGALLPFVILLVFLELGLRFQKQFLKHLPLVGIGRDLEHCPEILNVLSSDKTLYGSLPWAIVVPVPALR